MMLPKLLPADARARNRRRWSFRFSGLTSITTIAVGVWKFTPDEWHPALPPWSQYVVMFVAIAFALLASASHQVAQPSLQRSPPTVPPNAVPPPEH